MAFCLFCAGGNGPGGAFTGFVTKVSKSSRGFSLTSEGLLVCYLLLENLKIKAEAATSASVPKTLMRVCFSSLISSQRNLKSSRNINRR